MNVEFQFSQRQQVTMNVSGVTGEVIALWIDLDEIKWTQVRYVDGNKNIQCEWVREGELKVA